MAFTTLFVADDATCAALFVAVRRPLPHPITKVGYNPLTRQVLGGASWDPGDVDAARVDDDEIPPSVRNDPALVPALTTPTDAPPVAPAPGSEGGIPVPARLAALPHAVARGVTGFELEALAELLLGRAAAPARILEPHPDDGFVEALASDAVPALAELDDAAAADLLERWNARLAASRRRVESRALTALRALATEAAARGAHVLVHVPG